ncbi:hypothetical protein J5J10_07245 [Ciceribacter sp. L1K23]|uniref:hypothetical protein n=1 Tax=Ciceribacter sp. L1K23 TaxID=2820276 RepID=UPI001B83A4CF|nr:hypothetical protein [Ciceribacter sp. L1K23]MBR0555473.1 hypothetical protein [Ciceribacter sp. L1K23]
MIRYHPIDAGVTVPCTDLCLSGMHHSYVFLGKGDPLVEHEGNPFSADFSFTETDGTSRILRVSFDHADIVRVLDEVYLDSEQYGLDRTGLVHRHFAYRVENSRFWNAQSEFYRQMNPSAIHYRFITATACLDVLTAADVQFSVFDDPR